MAKRIKKVRWPSPPRLRKIRIPKPKKRKPVTMAPPMPKPRKGIVGTGLTALEWALSPIQRIGELPHSLAYPLQDIEEDGRKRAVPRPFGQRLKESALSLVPFGQTAGIYKPTQAESPYEFWRGTSRTFLRRGGAPEGAVRWGGRIGGFGGAIATDPFAYLGAGAGKVVPAASRLGRVFQRLGAPGRAMARYGVQPATRALKAVRGVPGVGRAARFLTKQRSVWRGVKAPFVGASKFAKKYADQPGVVGGLAKGIRNVEQKLKRAFTFKTPGGQVEVAAMRQAGAWNVTAANGLRSVETMRKGGRRALQSLDDFSKSPGVSGKLRATLDKMGTKCAKEAVKTLSRQLADDLPRQLMRLREEGKVPLGLTDDAVRLMRSWSDDLHGVHDSLKALEQTAFLREGKMPEAIRAAMLKKLQAGKPLTQGQIAALPAAARHGFPVAMASPRVGYAAHLMSDDALKWMWDLKKWPDLADEAKALLYRKPGGLTRQQIDALYRVSAGAAKKTRKYWKGQRPRLDITRHLSAEELNAIGNKIGYAGDLVVEHAGLAAAARIAGTGQKVAFEQAKLGVGQVAMADPELRQVAAGLRRSLANADRYSVPWKAGLLKGTGPLEGFYLLKDPRVGHVLLDEDLAMAVANLDDLFSPRTEGFARSLVKWYDKVLSGMKTLTLHVPPGVILYNTRNFYDDTARMIVAAGFDTVADGYSLRYAMSKAPKSFGFADGARQLDLSDLRSYLAHSALTGGFYRAESALATGTRFGPQGGALRAMGRPGQVVSEFLEDFRREAFLAGLLHKNSNLPFDEALGKSIDVVRKTMFAYPEITAFERHIPARAMFFYRFLRHNIPFQIQALFKRPFYMMLIAKGPEMMLGEPMTAEERELMPEWLHERMGFKIGGVPGHPIYSANLGFSIQDLNKLWPGTWDREVWGALAPPLRIPFELKSGQYFFFDRDIVERNQIWSPAVAKVFQTLNPAWRQIKGENFVKPATARDGRKYWIVPAYVMYAISNLRPANDVMKLLDPRRHGDSWVMALAGQARWMLGGGKEYPISMEREKFHQQKRAVVEGMERMRAGGAVGQYTGYYPRRGIELTPEEERRRRLLMLQQRFLR